jgi:hypothetical protein
MTHPIQKIQLADIDAAAGTQIRECVDYWVVQDYVSAMKEGDQFPPVVLFYDGTTYYIGDGFHRYHASKNCDFIDIDADVRQGSIQDAIWFALGANRKNGQRLSSDDKRKAIRLALEKFPEKSQSEICEQIGCSQSYVAYVKKDVINSDNVPVPAVRTDSLGRRQPTRKPRKVEPEQVADIPAEKPKRMKYTPPCNAVHLADLAMMHLSQIKKDDTRIEEAIRMIEGWAADMRSKS